MELNKQTKGPRFVRYLSPIIDALINLGGSGHPSEVKDFIAEKLSVSEQEQNEQLLSGTSKFSKDIDWARFYLAKAGYLDSSKYGVWSLTEKGRNYSLSQTQALELVNEINKGFRIDRQRKKITITESDKDSDEPLPADDFDHRASLLSILQSLPADGFERLCQRLLRESGFEMVTITGRSGDGGLDGIGILQMNPFVSFKVLFQCKRYSGSVTVSQVRDFRGAMMGRTDKGIIITTGTFTPDAKREANREGVPPLELVDGEKLLDMFESLELGLKPKKAYDLDPTFFEEFR